MSGKFASMTASLLVRKGDAAPSAIVMSASKLEPMTPLRPRRSSSAPPLLIVPDGAKSALPRSDRANASRRRMVTLPPTDSDTIALIAVKKDIGRHELLRLAEEAGGNGIVVPVDVERHADGSATLSLLGAPECFTHDEETGRWVGTEGSAFAGGPDVFDEEAAWSVAITFDQGGWPSIEICHDGESEQLIFEPGNRASAFS